MKIFLTLSLMMAIWILLAALLYKTLLSWRVKYLDNRLLIRVDGLLSKAMIPKTKYYNGMTHMIISFLLGASSYIFIRRYLGTFSSFSLSILVGILPTVFLRITQSINEQKIRKDAANFYATFANYCSTGSDIFSAFRSAIPELNEPFRSVIRKMIAKYDTRVDPVQCLHTAAEALEAAEVQSFFKTLIFQYIEGGDVVKLTNDYIKDLGQLIELDEKEGAEDQILSLGIYLLIAAQFFFLGLFLTSNQRELVVGTMYGEVALTINFLLSIILVLMTFIKPRRS